MSVIVKSKLEISRSPINQSTSKQMYSFSRAARFPPLKTKGYCDTFYTLPSVTMTRYASLGKGTKSDFTRTSRGANPNFYSVKRDFDPDNLRGPKFSFGICREKYAKVYYETNKMFDKNIPGPGKYNYLKSFGADAPKFTMRERFHTSEGKSRGRLYDNPGPGQYPPVVNINEKGKYPVSKFKNITLADFGGYKSKRFNYNYNKNPAPNAYELKSLMGQNFNSKYKSSQDKTMLGRYKDYDSRENYPGPGQYTVFSEFGIYESKYAHTTPNENHASTSKKENSHPEPSSQAQTKPTEETKPVSPKPEKKPVKKEPEKKEPEKVPEPEKTSEHKEPEPVKEPSIKAEPVEEKKSEKPAEEPIPETKVEEPPAEEKKLETLEDQIKESAEGNMVPQVEQ